MRDEAGDRPTSRSMVPAKTLHQVRFESKSKLLSIKPRLLQESLNRPSPRCAPGAQQESGWVGWQLTEGGGGLGEEPVSEQAGVTPTPRPICQPRAPLPPCAIHVTTVSAMGGQAAQAGAPT